MLKPQEFEPTPNLSVGSQSTSGESGPNTTENEDLSTNTLGCVG